MSVMAGKDYKRSWKNLLLNKRYQLRFTLFMVGIAAVLMAGLGIWVMKVANEATTVAMARVRGEACPKIPELSETPASDDSAAVPMKLDDGTEITPQPPVPPPPPPPPPTPPPAPSPAAALAAVANLWCGTPASCKPATAEPLSIKAPHCDDYVKKRLADPASAEALRKAMISVVHCEGGLTVSVADVPEPEHHVTVQIDESSMTLTPTVPNDYADTVVKHWTCEMRQAGAIDSLERGRHLILWVLLATGIVLSLGLAVYGIKMTHRVAGPLFKVSLYLAKMRDGRFDRVYNLRKGDQLVDFYDHFKTAHAGVVKLEKDDVEQIKAVIAAAEAAGVGDHEAVAELKKALARKEKSLE
ncbi:MAG TPA: hypothetical protein VGF94_22025 [Kofleriaceae bacterium]